MVAPLGQSTTFSPLTRPSKTLAKIKLFGLPVFRKPVIGLSFVAHTMPDKVIVKPDGLYKENGDKRLLGSARLAACLSLSNIGQVKFEGHSSTWTKAFVLRRLAHLSFNDAISTLNQTGRISAYCENKTENPILLGLCNVRPKTADLPAEAFKGEKSLADPAVIESILVQRPMLPNQNQTSLRGEIEFYKKFNQYMVNGLRNVRKIALMFSVFATSYSFLFGVAATHELTLMMFAKSLWPGLALYCLLKPVFFYLASRELKLFSGKFYDNCLKSFFVGENEKSARVCAHLLFLAFSNNGTKAAEYVNDRFSRRAYEMMKRDNPPKAQEVRTLLDKFRD